MPAKNYCPASQTEDYERREGPVGTLIKCCTCGRVLKPTGTGKLRLHQRRNRNTASLDSTRDILWGASERHSAQEVLEAVREADAAAEGDSNDSEISALSYALELALSRWPEITTEKRAAAS